MAQYNQVTKLRRMEEALHRTDPNLDPRSNAFKTAIILVASAYVGPNIRRIARFTGYSYKFTEEVGQRLRKNRIWVKDMVNYGEWTKKDGGVAFWLDVCVGDGTLRKVHSTQDHPADHRPRRPQE